MQTFALKILTLQAAFIGIAGISSAQILTPNEEFEKQYRPPLSLQGQLISFRMLPATGSGELYVAGVPADELDFRSSGTTAYVRPGEGVLPYPAPVGTEGIADQPAADDADMMLDLNFDGTSDPEETTMRRGAEEPNPIRSEAR